ncbi:hypothetical protein [Actinopolymorpha pittospori]|uniref:Uncharacterized protein n=1 Tax=Actinopolymorpha pittospori TaxID=648752 RepID=A0A927N133_9ACTN|nr:hypothetical protein [Actinopolymorpha pittospori]MBE1610209.1 hypothetical protein [Actinopolymorpha pittospori]
MTTAGGDHISAGGELRVLVAPQLLDSRIGEVWHSGLVASRTVVAIELIVDCTAGPATFLDDHTPLKPEVWLSIDSGHREKRLRMGGEAASRKFGHATRVAILEPDELAGACTLRVVQDDLGVDYSASFTV